MQRGLHRGTAHASKGGYLVDWEVADALALDLASDDAEHRDEKQRR